jgi:hypothetical protein
VGYVGNKGTRLILGQNINYDILGPAVEKHNSAQIAALETYVPNPFYGIITNTSSPLSGTTVPAYQLQLPFPQFSSFQGDAPPWGISDYNALQVKLEKRFSNGLQFLLTYVWSKSIDDNSALGENGELGSFSELQNPNNLELERGLSTFDIPQVFQFTYVYALPFGRGKALFGNANPVLDAFIGGWNTTGIWRFNSGRPIALQLEEGTSLPTYGPQRPDLIGTLKCNNGANFLTDYFANPQVVTTPAPFTLGTAPRTDGSCRQPGEENSDLSIYKDFSLSKVREGMHLEVRFETYNAFNHVQFGGPNTVLNSGSFGVITSQANAPREVQLVAKFYW